MHAVFPGYSETASREWFDIYWIRPCIWIRFRPFSILGNSDRQSLFKYLQLDNFGWSRYNWCRLRMKFLGKVTHNEHQEQNSFHLDMRLPLIRSALVKSRSSHAQNKRNSMCWGLNMFALLLSATRPVDSLWKQVLKVALECLVCKCKATRVKMAGSRDLMHLVSHH